MSDYRRYFVPGGTFFFTVVTYRRRPILTDELGRTCLRHAISKIRTKYPFEINAIVLLPEHLHALWTLPPGDDKYSMRWRRIKEEFTVSFLAGGGVESDVSYSRRKRNERGIWQRRFWEHTIKDDDDFDRHFDYIHWNPVKHGHVESPKDWKYSSFHRWHKYGVYDLDWGRSGLDFSDLTETAMELE